MASCSSWLLSKGMGLSIFSFLKKADWWEGLRCWRTLPWNNNLIDKSLGELHFFTSNEPACLVFCATKPPKKQMVSIMVFICKLSRHWYWYQSPILGSKIDIDTDIWSFHIQLCGRSPCRLVPQTFAQSHISDGIICHHDLAVPDVEGPHKRQALWNR